MFHRRKRSVSVTRQNATPSPSAQSAATQAFLASRSSNANLSTSAAATALRSMSPAPAPVSDVQTKRMLLRQASTGSTGTDGRELRRKNSSGSMTERTFRSPSPNRPGTTNGNSNGVENAPPVPPMPKTYNNDSAHRRAASMEPPTRVLSPPPKTKGGRVASLDRTPASTQRPSQTMGQSSRMEMDELERSGSHSSINFSYPTSARPSSPPTARPTPQPQSHVVNGIPRQGASQVQNELSQTAAQPVRRKKKKISPGSTEGSHLANGGMGGKPIGTAVDVSSPTSIEQNQRPRQSSPERKIPSMPDPRSDGPSNSLVHVAASDSSTEKASAKRTQRASGVLHKQPSVVREDWEGEQEDLAQLSADARERAKAGLSPVSSPSNVESKKEAALQNVPRKAMDISDQSIYTAPPKPQLITSIPASAASATASRGEASQTYLDVTKEATRSGRQTSISPSRSTRFSTHLASEFSGKPRHEPPPRSVSPAKSALKHHSPSPQSSSPIDGITGSGWKRASQASSETSDNASMTSTDGFGPRSQKKKPVRVSFEAEPESAGVATDGTPSDSSLVKSPQQKESTKRGRLGKSKGAPLDSIPAEDDMEEVLKPRPVLPSFGSVRGRREGSVEPSTVVADAASPSSSETSSTSHLTATDVYASGDLAIGGILAREPARLQSHQDNPVSQPLKSLTTRMEGKDTVRDLMGKTDGAWHDPPNTARAPTLALDIPSISIQPATPGIGESESRDEWLVEVPGGFPEAPRIAETSAVSATSDTIASVERATANSSPAAVGISEPPPPQTMAVKDYPVTHTTSLSEALRQRDEPDDDNASASSSIYSDAAEDLSDLEGDGFGSINAIVESPAIGAPAPSIITPPDSPLVGRAPHEWVGGITKQDSWNTAEAHWGRVAQQQRNGDHDRQKEQMAVQKKKPRKKKTRSIVGEMTEAPRQTTGSPVPISPSKAAPQPSPYPIMGKDKSTSGQTAMRRSLRSKSEETREASGFRSSMRTQKTEEKPSQTSQLPSQAKGALQKKKTPLSPSVNSPIANATVKDAPAISTQKRTLPLSRRLSNESDSSSSFKRSRRPASSGGKFTMRTSMRGVDDRPTSPAAPAGRGVRSASPQNRRPFSPIGQGTMRTTMRGAADSGPPASRKAGQESGSSGPSGFGKSGPKAKDSSSKPITSRLKSRLVDSDDDDDDQQRPSASRKRSRFEDSSDDEAEMVKYRPVRGIPRKAVQDDSTDLEDSSDDGEKRNVKARRHAAKSAEANGGTDAKADKETEMTSSPASPVPASDRKKKGIFGRFRSKKTATGSDPNTLTSGDQEQPADRGQPASPAVPPSPDAKGKLQRKHIPPQPPPPPPPPPQSPQSPLPTQRTTSDSWPLPSSPLSETDGPVPSTAAVNGHPGMGARQDTSSTVMTDGGSSAVGRTGKKKKFPLLRKALGLHD